MQKKLQILFSMLFLSLFAFTAKAQEDITDQYLTNADLSTVDQGWTYFSDAFKFTDWKTDGDVPVVEFYSQWNAGNPVAITQKDFKFSQTITLPAGDYHISVNAFYRNGNGDGTNPDKAWIFAGEKRQNVVALTSAGVGAYTGSSDLYKAANAFSLGDFKNGFDFSLVEEQAIEVGFQGFFNTSLSWCILGPVKLYKYSLEDYLKDYREKVAEAQAIDGKMGADEKAALEAAIKDESEFSLGSEVAEAISALNTAIANAIASISNYQTLGNLIAKGEFYKANSSDDEAKAAYDEAVHDIVAAYENGTIADFAEATAAVNAAQIALAKTQTAPDSDLSVFIVNPEINGADGWTIERPVGGNGPLLGGTSFEYWAGNANPRAEAMFDYYQVIEGLPNGLYTVTADMYNSLNGEGGDYTVFAPTCGVYAASGEAEEIALVEVDGTELTTYTTEAIAVTDGKLRLGVKSVSPLAARWFVADNFKLTLVKTLSATDIDYNRAIAAIEDGKTYRIFTEVEDTKYYISPSGYLVDNDLKAGTFTFTKVAGEEFEYGFFVDGGSARFSNPPGTNESNLKCGYINPSTGTRATWDAQAFLLNADGKFAIRATNVAGGATSGWSWVANSYWVVESVNDVLVAQYDWDPAYIWQIEENVDPRPAALEIAKAWPAKLQAMEGLVTDAAQYSSNAWINESTGLPGLIDDDYSTYFHTTWQGGVTEAHYLQAQLPDATDEFFFYFVKRDPVTNSNINNRPTRIAISGSNDGETFTPITEISEGLPTTIPPVYYMSGKITATEAYKYIRFTVLDTNNHAQDSNGNYFFTFSEFYILPSNELTDDAVQYIVGDFTDLTYEAVAEIESIDSKLDNYFVEIPVNVVFNGEVAKSETVTQVIGQAPTIPTSFDNGLVELSDPDVETVTAETEAINITATWKGPFDFTTSVEDAKWYNMTIRTNYYVAMDETEPYKPTTDKDLIAPESQWAFAGNPYSLIIFNKATGATMTLAKDGSNVVMREGFYTWELFANNKENGFVIREAGTENNWVNQNGGSSGPLQFWNSANGRNDDGSTFRVSEVSYKDALIAELAEANAIAETALVGGLFQKQDAAAVEALNAAITAQQAVADNEEATSAEIEAAYYAIVEAIAAYEAAPIVTPKDGAEYTFQMAYTDDGVFYMNLAEGESTEEEPKVTLQAEPMALTFVPAETEGQYYLKAADAELYLGKNGTNAWDMTADPEKKAPWTFTPLADGTYLINNVAASGQYVAATAVRNSEKVTPVAGAPIFYDKSLTNGYVNWTITYIIPDVVLNAPTFSAEEGTQDEPNMLPVGETLKINFTADNLEDNGYNAEDLQVKVSFMISGDLPENMMDMSSETVHRVLPTEVFYIPLGETDFPVALKEGYVYQNIVVKSAELVVPAKEATQEEEAVPEVSVATYTGAPVQLHWIGVPEDPSADAAYARALASIESGKYYRIATTIEGEKYYVTEDGKLTNAVDDGGIFTITIVTGGALKDKGFQISSGSKRFTNPPLSNDVANLTSGVFATSTNNRVDWETQVLFLTGGKYAIRSCNTQPATSSWGDAGRTFWTWAVEEAVVPRYTYDETYVWEIEGPLNPIQVTYALYEVDGEEAISTVTKKQEANSEISIPADFKAQAFIYNYATEGTIGEEDCTIKVIRSFKEGIVHALADLSNAKAYTIRCDRGALLTKDGYMASTAHNSLTNAEAADFAVISYEDHLYLYSVADQKFVTNTGALSEMPTHGVEDAIVMTAQTDPYFLYNFVINGTNNGLNTNGNDPYGYVINTWMNADPGNLYYMIESADFDATAALTALEAYFHPSYFVTYVVKDAAGNELFTSEPQPTMLNTQITTLPAEFQRPFTTYNEVDVTISELETTVEFIATFAFPFEVSTSFDEAKWYNMTIRTNYYVAMDETEPYYPKADKDLTAAASQWAFTGDAYNGIVLWNKAAGEGFALTKDGSNVVMREGAYAWEIFANNDGFVLREKGSDNNWINQNGGASGPLQFWNSANGKTDDGSTFRVSEVVIPEVLFSVLPNIESGVQEEAGESTGFTNVELGTEFKLTITAENLEVNGLNPDDLTISINMVMESAFDSPAWAMGNDEETGLPHSTRYVAQGLSFSYAEEITLEDVVFGEDYPYIQNINIVGISLMNGDEVVATIAEPVAVRFLVVTKDGIPVGIKSLNSALQNADIYDMAGRKVQKVQRGNIYIINGKKVAVK